MLDQVNSAAESTAAATSDLTFAPSILANDLYAVCDAYSRLFATLNASMWDKTAPRGQKEWTLHETIAHLCALNGAGLESITHTLRGETYTFQGLESRYLFNAYNRKGIDERLAMPPDELFAEFSRIHGAAADIARELKPGQAEITAALPIYNRPVQIAEALSIMILHAGLFHAAQIAEPAGVSPLWTQFSPEIRHRLIGRVMRAFSLLYRHDIGDPLQAVIAFLVNGPNGGEWYIDISPESVTSGEGSATSPSLVLKFREADDFYRMFTGRMNFMFSLISRKLKLRGDLRLFLRMKKLFSVDARP